MSLKIPPHFSPTSIHQDRREPPPRGPLTRPHYQATALEPHRGVSARDGREPEHDAQWLADGVFFEHWLAPLGSNGSSQGRDSAGQQVRAGVDLQGSLATADCNQLVEELTMRLPGAGQALQATLFMPNLGRIALNARPRPPLSWEVDLDCDEARAAEHLRAHRRQCQDDLGQALRLPVELRISHQGLS